MINRETKKLMILYLIYAMKKVNMVTRGMSRISKELRTKSKEPRKELSKQKKLQAKNAVRQDKTGVHLINRKEGSVRWLIVRWHGGKVREEVSKY